MNEEIRIFSSSPAPMRVQMAGISHCDGNYHIRRSLSDITVVEYVTRGLGYVTEGGKDHPVGPGSVYILRREQPQNYYSSQNDPWEKIFINIGGELPEQLLREYGITDRWLFSGEGLYDLFEEVAQIVRSPAPREEDDIRLSGIFLQILARISRRTSFSVYSEEAVQMKRYLDRNTDRIVSNEELSRSVFRSPDHCVKCFRASYGTTPYDYQLTQKMRIARRLLRDTSLSVSEIGASVGYDDPCYFSGLFRRKVGSSPRNYRKENRNQPKNPLPPTANTP